MNGLEMATQARLQSKAKPDILVAYWTRMEDWNLLRGTPYRPYHDDYQD